VRRIPILVVSGFLGSGKTTLVRALLGHAQERGLRVAVVSNEFGALGIDEALLKGGGERFVELAGGCVCCELSDELTDTLEALRAEVDPDWIVIETSGLALPYETQLNFYRPPTDAWVGDEAVVVVVDAERLRDGEDLDGTFEDQVGSADLLVLHKVDLVDADVLPRLEARLQTINPDAPILRAAHGNVDPDVLFPDERAWADERRRTRAGHACDHEPGTSCDHAHPHRHHDAWVTEELDVPTGLTPEAAQAWIHARRGVRTKGFVMTTEGVRIVQGVGRRTELIAPDGRTVPDGLVGRVVCIRRA
jgi:cobalamin biosynthesis protein CobW